MDLMWIQVNSMWKALKSTESSKKVKWFESALDRKIYNKNIVRLMRNPNKLIWFVKKKVYE